MPAADDVVWLDVLPSMKKFGPALVAGSKGPATAAGASAGKGFGKAALAGAAVVAGGAALATKALYNVGATFDDMADAIRIGTGKSGKDLDAMVGIAKNVGREVPVAFDKIGQTVADLNTRLGLSGPTLQTVSKQFLEAGRILEEDVDVQSVTGALSAFRIEGEDTVGAMDTLFQVSQATGVGMNDLGKKLAKQGVIAEQMGLSFEDTAAFVGVMDKAGVNSNAVMSAMSAGLVKLTQDGEAPQDAFKRVTGEIQGFVDAGDQAAALDLAGKAFGSRGAGQLVAALKSGKVNLEDMAGSAGLSEDKILDVAAETGDMAEQWQLFKNRGLALIEPVATRVFNLFGKGLTWVNDKGVPALQKMARWMGENKTLMVVFGIAVGTAVTGLLVYKATVVTVTAVTKAWNIAQKMLNGTMRLNPIGLVVTALVLLAGAAVVAYKRSETFRRIVDGAWAAIRKGISVAWSIIKVVFAAYVFYIKNVLAPVFMWLWKNIVKPVFGWLKNRIVGIWEGFIRPAFNGIRTGVRKVGDAFAAVKDKIGTSWGKIKSLVKGPIDFVIGIINKFIRAVNKIPGVELPLIGGGGKATGNPGPKRTSGRTAYATGGPVFGPGTGTSDSILARLSNNEHVWTAREVARAGGHAAVEQMRRAVMAGRRVAAYAKGGRVVPGAGKRHGSGYPWASWAGDFPNPSGTPVRAWKSGVVAMIKRLTTSYGNHIRMNHTDGTSSLYAHLSRIATTVGAKVKQGQVIGNVGSTGNSTGPHLHFESMGGSYKGGKGGGGSIWDKITGTVKGFSNFVGKRMASILNIPKGKGGLFGAGGLQKMVRTIGGSIRDNIKGKLFDNGGLANGTGYMVKDTIAPERVLSPQQTAAFEQAMGGVGNKGTTTERPIYMDGSIVAVLREVAGQEAEVVFNQGLASDDRYERMDR